MATVAGVTALSPLVLSVPLDASLVDKGVLELRARPTWARARQRKDVNIAER